VNRHWADKIAIIAAIGLVPLLLGTALIVTSPVDAESGMSDLEFAQLTKRNCQIGLEAATTSGERTRMNQCITIQDKIIAKILSATPTPTGTTSPTPTLPSSTPTTTPSASGTVTPTAATFSPSPTSPPGPQGCAAFPAFPNVDCTGVPAGWQPVSTRTTDLVVSTAGTIVQDVRLVNADIRVQAANVTIRRVEVQGGSITAPCNGNLIIEDTSVIRAPGQVTRYDDGQVIGDAGFTLRRVKVDGVPEGIRLGVRSCGLVTIEESFIRIEKPDVCGDWHGDGVQGYQGGPLVVTHSTIVMGSFGPEPCEGTSPFFYPDQGNTRADIDGALVVGGRWSAFRLGTPATVRGLYLVGGYDVKCSRMEVWQAFNVTINSNFQVLSSTPQACLTEGGN
jgi:hypothetical protein